MKTTLAALKRTCRPLSQIAGFIGQERQPPPVTVPPGFTPIFNGKDLTGWHVSQTNHHGTTPNFHVVTA